MKNTFEINIKPKASNTSFQASLFDIRNLGAAGAIKFFLKTNKYKKVKINTGEKNEALFNNMLRSFMLLNIVSEVTDSDSHKVSYFLRLKSMFNLIIASVKLKKYPSYVRKSISKYPSNPEKGEMQFSNVLYLKTNLSFGVKAGGSVGHIAGVVNALNERFEVKYISAEDPIMINESVDIVDVSFDHVDFSFPYELNSLILNSAYIDVSAQEIEKTRPTVIYQRLTLFNYAGAYLSNKFNIPLVVEYNGSEVVVQKNWGRGLKYAELALELEQYMLNTASKIITVSKVLVDELIERGVDKDKIVCYPNCIDPVIYNNDAYSNDDVIKVRGEYGISVNDLVFTFIGTFGKWHGIEFLADAIKKLIDNEEGMIKRESIRFLLIGDGLLSQSTRKILSGERYSKYVIFTGSVPQDHAPLLLNASDVFLSPHIKQEERFIGSPTKLFEYMSFAKPIIASDLEQIGEVLKNSIKFPSTTFPEDVDQACAILFEPNNTEAFLDALKFVLLNRDICKIIGTNAKNEVMNNYTWNVHVEKLWS